MWIISTGGFVSAVQDPKDSDRLVIRSRDRQSLVTMLEGIELAGAAAGDTDGELYTASSIVTGQGTDYRYRVRLSKATFAIWVQYEVLNFLTYPNFKNALTESRGKVWHDAAMNVWVDMLKTDDGPKTVGQKSWDLSGAPEPTPEELEAIEAAFPDEGVVGSTIKTAAKYTPKVKK